MQKMLTTVLFLVVSMPSLSAYDSNMQGKIAAVLTYADGDYILFSMENQPGSHPGCLADYFSIDAAIPAQRRQQIFSRLLLAYAKGEVVNIGYDGQGDCSNGRIRVHRVG